MAKDFATLGTHEDRRLLFNGDEFRLEQLFVESGSLGETWEVWKPIKRVWVGKGGDDWPILEFMLLYCNRPNIRVHVSAGYRVWRSVRVVVITIAETMAKIWERIFG